MNMRRGGGIALGITVLSLTAVSVGQESTESRERIGVADYNAAGQLRFPDDADRWIALGAGVGGTYPEERAASSDQPRILTMVQMEPAAYDYFLDNGRYADGTMLLLQFYSAQETPDPALQGFVQGPMVQREIHVIDKELYAEEGRAFFMFPPQTNVAPPLPVGSECVTCHLEHGDFDGTFTQFYPTIRHLISSEAGSTD